MPNSLYRDRCPNGDRCHNGCFNTPHCAAGTTKDGTKAQALERWLKAKAAEAEQRRTELAEGGS